MIHETGAHAPILLPGVNSKIYVAILFATYWRIVTMNTVMHSYCTMYIHIAMYKWKQMLSRIRNKTQFMQTFKNVMSFSILEIKRKQYLKHLFSNF